MFAATISATIVFLLFLLTHSLIFHFLQVTYRVRTMSRIVLLLSPIAFFFTAYLIRSGVELPAPNFWFVRLTPLLLCTFFWFGYLQFYFLVERGVSTRLIIHFLESKDQSLNEVEADGLYSFRNVIERRVAQMVEVGLLTVENSQGQLCYRNSKKGERIGKLFRTLKDFLRLGAGG